jgi:hypothetical protein
MKMDPTPETDDDLRAEYDLAQLQGGVRGKYHEKYRARLHMVRITPELAEVFPTEEAVNQALTMLVKLARQQVPAKAE